LANPIFPLINLYWPSPEIYLMRLDSISNVADLLNLSLEIKWTAESLFYVIL
jgi:hypothetical protein